MMVRRILIACAAGAAAAFAGGDAAADTNRDSDVAALVARATTAHERLMRGDIIGYRQAIDVTPDFVLMDPFGGRPTGAPKSEAHWNRIGRFFREGTAASFDLVGAYRSTDLIVLVANERAHVAVGSLDAQEWFLRVTLVFRRDDGAWRLAHRHADPLVRGIGVEEAARLTLGQGELRIGP
ncbi:ketosteroid isomerase-like protein [Sphingopyxis sp. OAS728]|uniref:YybH family protein n=1 Tax=Sphingopyxis sp. OAS728 TaxID=2663823 RepID=UPI001789AE96|nr:nuclear transport factor 2 family protein [Sphingopyxis sp. OAS728]MBE1529105.1 ketosteroid isomerase-like protein [Sphingopyxis sp. OAS728]